MFYLCLVVQADEAIAKVTNRSLEASGIKPYSVQSIASALSIIRQWRFDVVLFDADGFGERTPRMLAELRKTRLPVLAISSESDEQEQIRMFESGATEFVAKPTSLRLTAIRLQRLVDLQREKPADVPPEIRLGPLLLDTRRALASVGPNDLALTTRQFDLLLLLTVRSGEFVHRQAIASALGQRSNEGSRSTDMLISRIRRKLREAGDDRLQVLTVHGRGYCLRYSQEADAGEEPLLRWCA